MAAPRVPGQTAIDYVTLVLSPVLIMGLVGSLVFFLIEVCYHTGGPWKERLQWILFFFVFGAVLTARISMDPETARRFWLYGSILAGAAYLGVQMFVEYPPAIREVSFLINLFLILTVWWCAHRLTWDCTNVDEEADISGEGVLQAAGLEQAEGQQQEEPKEDEDKTLWQRWQDYQEKRGKKRTLGVWVVYFSLAVLPIFGLGQAMIPLTAADRRQFSFWLMTVYVACGLGLLLTTCFLGLRRYLRQKRLQMPAAMTTTWLTAGGGLILALVVLGALLPRPYPEYSLLDVIDPAGSQKRKASSWAILGGSPGEGEGRPGEGGKDGKVEGKGEGQDKDGKSGKGGDKGGDKGGKGGDKGGDKGGKGGDKGEKDGKGGGDKDKGSKDGGEKDKGGKDGEKAEQDKGKAKERDDQPKDGPKDKGREGGGRKQQGEKPKEQQGQQQTRSSTSSNSLLQFVQRIGPWLKWIVFGVLAVVVLIALFRGGLGWLANFSAWAKGLLEAWRKFWERLFGGSQPEPEGGEEEVAEASDPQTPFSAFSNPFDSGRAERLSPRQLVRYTFAALEAWARERDLGRRKDETAMEFVTRLSNEAPGLEAEARRLAQLHARAEYGPGALPANSADVVRSFWDRFERVVESPLSA